MCLSTAYKNKIDDANILMKNVLSVAYVENHIVLTDLMERKMVVEGSLSEVNLVENYIIIEGK